MKTNLVRAAVALPLVAGHAVAQTNPFPILQTETEFLDACEQDKVQREPTSVAWARAECQVKWQWANAAGPMAQTVLERSVASGAAASAAMPAGVALTSTANGLRFDWQEPGSEGRYNVTGALRSRGVTLQTLGCPQYPGASMGREKVMLATAPGHPPFLLTVYSRAAPTGFEPGVYEVDADFSGAVPDMAALQAGRYPGGGGRAFAGEPTGWVSDCPDPE